MTTPTAVSPNATGASISAGETEIVSRARRFLLHDSVKDSPVQAKRRFLESKGLTSSQIDDALRAVESQARPAAAGSSVAPTATATADRHAIGPATGTSTPAEPTPARRAPWILLGSLVGAGAVLAASSLGLTSALSSVLGTAERDARPALETEANDPAGSKAADDASVSAASLSSPESRPSASSNAGSASGRAEAALAAMRELQHAESAAPSSPTPARPPPAPPQNEMHERAAALNEALDEMEAQSHGQPDAIPKALHTLLMLINGQLRRPTDPSYHRLHRQNPNLRRLLELPGASPVLEALGFVAGSGSFWVWRGGKRTGDDGEQGGLPNDDELALIGHHKEALSRRLQAQEAEAAVGDGLHSGAVNTGGS